MELLGTEQVYAGAWLGVREDTVRRPDGSTGVHAVVEAEDIAMVLAVQDGRVHLVEQDRHPVAGPRWELPSGTLDRRRDADAASAARRELREETGLVPAGLTRLGTLEVLPSTSAQRCHVFLASGLTEGPPRHDPEEQGMRSTWFERSAVDRMIAGGVLTDAKSLAAYALLLVHESTARG